MAKKGFLEGYKTFDTSGGFGNPKKWKEAFSQRMGKEEAEAIIGAQAKGPHEVLGVPKEATATEIKKAYRKLIMHWHPDRNQNREEEALVQSKLIIAAYELLKDKNKY